MQGISSFKEWTAEADSLLEELFLNGAFCAEVARRLGRSEDEINQRLLMLGHLG